MERGAEEGGVRLASSDTVELRAAKRARRRLLRWLRWAAGSTLWLALLVAVHRWDRDATRLYIMASILAAVLLNLKWEKRRPGEVSAYYILNPDGRRLAGEMDLRAFGIRNASRSAEAGVRSGSTAGRGHALGADGRRASPERLREDPAYQLELAQRRGVKRHHACPCGSGKRFCACCEPLQLELRQRGVHLAAP